MTVQSYFSLYQTIRIFYKTLRVWEATSMDLGEKLDIGRQTGL